MKSKYYLGRGTLRIVFFISVFFILATNAFSQVGGISGSKLGSYCVDVVDHHTVEFEPAFYHFASKSYWDNDSKIIGFSQSNDSVKWVTGMNFRITYGLFDKLEIGATISSDLQLSNWGARYVFIDNNKLGMAIIAGANIPLGNKTVDKSLRLSNTIASVGGGLVLTSYFNESFSIDFNAQFFRFIQNTHDQNRGSLYLNTDLGYYLFSGNLQLIAGLGYQHSHYDSYNTHILTIYPGITVETGKSYIIVLSAPFDVWGMNANKNFGVALALTVTLN